MRLLSRGVALVVALVVGVSGSAAAGTTESAQGETQRPPRVLIVSLPRVTWERLDAVSTPTIDRFLDDAAVASLSLRTVGAVTSPAAAYLTIGAGNRASGSTSVGADGEVLMSNATTEGGSVADMWKRRTGSEPAGRMVAANFPKVIARNELLLYGSEPGSLGEVLRDEGHTMGVVANADPSLLEETGRHAALAAVDRNGEGYAGEVGSKLLIADQDAPLGVRTNVEVVGNAVELAWEESSVLLVEVSDLERAETARLESTPEQGDRQFDTALRAADRLFGQLLEPLDLERDLVLIVAPTAPIGVEQLTAFAAAGPGIDAGWATSGSTRRAGFVSLPDIAATVLHHLEIEVPGALSATPVRSESSTASVAERIDVLVDDNAAAVQRDAIFGGLTVAYVVVLVLMLLLVAVSVATGRFRSPVLVVMNLAVMALPAVTYLGGLLPIQHMNAVGYGLALASFALVVALIAWWAGRGRPLAAPAVVAGVTVVLLGLDVATGAHLQINTIFGYSPIVAGRFAGFGNQAFSLIAISTLVLATALWGLSRVEGRPRPPWHTAALIGGFAVVVVIVGAPSMGSDVGGVLSSVPAFTVCTILLLGGRIRARTAALIGLGTLVVISVFAAVDLSRPVESRTHLGRFVSRLVEGEAGLILQRKLTANFNVLSSTVWTWVIPAALLFLAYLTWRPNSVLRQLVDLHPTFRAFAVSGVTLGVVAWVLNDSGVSMPAMMLAVALPFTSHLLMQAGHVPERDGPESALPDEIEDPVA